MANYQSTYTGVQIDAAVAKTLTDVTGPASATDNAIARFDLTTGKVIQNSGITISDADQMVIPAGADYTTAKVRNVILGTVDPTSEGNNGDIYIKVASLP